MTLLNRNITTSINVPGGSACGVFQRADFIHCIVIALATFLVYAWSAPRTVGLEDDGYFILAAYFNGIAHPPGYPLFTLLAHIATLIPFGSVALRVHLLSGLLGALACACLWCITRVLVKDKTAAYVAALSLAFSRVFWSQAIIAKGIYTLNVFLMLAAFLCVLAIRKRESDQGSVCAIKMLFLCYGLALSNHWPLVILTTPMFIAALWPERKRFYQFFVKGLPFLLLGLTPYVWMAIRSQMHPEIIFFGPIENITDFWHYLSRKPYVEVDYSPSAGWIDKLQYLQYVLIQTGEQYGPFGWPFVLAGLIFQKWKLPAELSMALILGYLGSTVFLVLLLWFDYEEYHKAFFSVYPLIAYTIAALWLGIGLTSILTLLMKKISSQSRGKILPVGFAALVVVSTLAVNAAWNYRHDDDWARLYAVTVLDSLPRGAILFTDGIADGAITYMNKIEDYRDDITLYSTNGILFKNRLFNSLYKNVIQARKAINTFIQSEHRPIYYITDLFQDSGFEYYGLYSRVLRNSSSDASFAIMPPGLLSYWKYILENAPRHPWENIHRTTLLYNGCEVLTKIEEAPAQNMSDNARLQELHTGLCDNLRGSYIMLTATMQRENPDWNRVRFLLEKAEGQLPEALLKSDISKLDYYRGMMYLKTGNREKGQYFLGLSLLKWDHPENPAYNELKK
jgi:hypothetical protein